jgi:hypothetical protein
MHDFQIAEMYEVVCMLDINVENLLREQKKTNYLLAWLVRRGNGYPMSKVSINEILSQVDKACSQ